MDAVARYVARKPMPPAVVAGADSAHALAAIRRLARAGLPVVTIDHRRSALGFRSRHAIGVHSPDPAAEPQRFVAFLVELGDALGRAAPTFPTDREYRNAIVASDDLLEGRYLVAAPGWENAPRTAYWALLGARLPDETSKTATTSLSVLDLDDPVPTLSNGARLVRGRFR